MRIGELLLQQKKLQRADLERVAAEVKPGECLVSTLIRRGLIDFDDGARALGEQMGAPCALAKHITGRDKTVVKLIPAELGRAACALPIGRTSGGALIVCVREPTPALKVQLEAAARCDVLMVVTPVRRLQDLVEQEYGRSPVEEFDVDFSSSVEVVPPPKMPPPPDMDALDPDSVRLALTDLDDARVDKDFTQSGQFTIPRAPTMPPRMTIEVVRAAFDRAQTRDAATDSAVGFLAGHWTAGLVLLVREGAAVGYRGHNVRLPETVRVPYGQLPTLSRALKPALATSASPAVVPVLVKGAPVAVIAAGDPLGDADEAMLGKLAELLSRTYERLA
jgi:hypothetical protein